MIPKINGSIKKLPGKMIFPTEVFTYNCDETKICVFKERLAGAKYLKCPDFVAAEENQALFRTIVEPDIKTGGYHFIVETLAIRIGFSDDTGLVNGLTTLYWLLLEGKGTIDCCDIIDEPTSDYRGLLLDCTRHFFDIDTVQMIVEQMALRKLNRLHWHLSDDQGWRIESSRFPKLNEIGSWRRELDGTEHGGFYTQQQIREIVSYAQARGIEIIPEIDMPGHVTAMIAAYPELSCSGEPTEVSNMFAPHVRVLCAGKDSVLKFVKELLEEVMNLFPSKYIHIGGDEVLYSEWGKCPDCCKRMRELGLSTNEELQGWFTKQIALYLQDKAKTPICWIDSLKSGQLPKGCITQYWDEVGEPFCDGKIDTQHPCIWSECASLYFDYISAMAPLRSAFRRPLQMRSGKMLDSESIIGYEGALWSEQFADVETLQKRAFPRSFALAERAWNGKTEYQDFLERCETELLNLKEEGIAFETIDEADPQGKAQTDAIVKYWFPILQTDKMFNNGQMSSVIIMFIRSKLEDAVSVEQGEQIIGILQRETQGLINEGN